MDNQAGFTLVQAIFILVVLGLLGVVMLRLAGTQNTTSIFALQGARAYQAARSGLEWGAARVSSAPNCNPAFIARCTDTFTVENFTVSVSCSCDDFVEGSPPAYPVFRFTSTAEFGSYGNPDYVQRRLESKVAFP
jgi:MSHA biogenesis protein MshP